MGWRSLLLVLTCVGWAEEFRRENGWRPLLDAGSLTGWAAQEGKPAKWTRSRAVGWDKANPKSLVPEAAPGPVLVNAPGGRDANLVTAEKFGDMELAIEFLIPQGSNSGVYLHGLYEVQILDSFGSPGPAKTSDCGAIYHRWIQEKPSGGSPPKVSASRPAGEWQTFRIFFRAPRFDTAGRKTENARFLRVEHNGKLIQENVAVEGPTRAHMNLAEAPLNPLMLQGDHGPVAFRNMHVRPLGRYSD